MLNAITAPAAEPVTQAEARLQCKADGMEDAALLDGYVRAARVLVESETGRALISQSWELVLDTWPECLVLPKPPSVSVTSIKYIDQSGTEQTLAGDQYVTLRRSTGEFEIVPAYGVTWPSPRAQRAAIRIRFVAGYGPEPANVPEPLRQAIRLLTEHWNKNRGAVSAVAGDELPLGVASLIFTYRIFY